METSWGLISSIHNKPAVNALPPPVQMLMNSDQGPDTDTTVESLHRIPTVLEWNSQQKHHISPPNPTVERDVI